MKQKPHPSDDNAAFNMTYRAKVLHAKNTSLVIEIDSSQMNGLHHQLGALTSLTGIVDSRATFTPSVPNHTRMNHTYGPEDIIEIAIAICLFTFQIVHPTRCELQLSTLTVEERSK